jgi:Zn-dependent peptidase ImmA (M78 family)/transcriptional regulator with XRE-family HTH domain
MDSKIIGQKIKELRKQHDVSGEELAIGIGKSNNSYISKLENGQKQNISLKEIIDICSYFNCDPRELIGEVGEATNKKKGFWDDPKFRDESLVSSEAQSSVSNYLPMIRKTYKELQKAGIVPRANSISRLGTKVEVENIAQQIRRDFGLGRWGIDIFSLVRNHFNIFVIDAEFGKSVGGLYSTDTKGNPVIVINSSIENTQRSVFSLAHELGHFLMDKNESDVDLLTDEEELADYFAAELLVPKESLFQLSQKFPDDEKELTKDEIINLAEIFTVSYGAILTRLVSTGLISVSTKLRLKQEKVMSEYRYKPEEYYRSEPIKSQVKKSLVWLMSKKKIGRTKAESILGDLIE